jgi:hypothetical protein
VDVTGLPGRNTTERVIAHVRRTAWRMLIGWAVVATAVLVWRVFEPAPAQAAEPNACADQRTAERSARALERIAVALEAANNAR